VDQLAHSEVLLHAQLAHKARSGEGEVRRRPAEVLLHAETGPVHADAVVVQGHVNARLRDGELHEGAGDSRLKHLPQVGEDGSRGPVDLALLNELHVLVPHGAAGDPSQRMAEPPHVVEESRRPMLAGCTSSIHQAQEETLPHHVGALQVAGDDARPLEGETAQQAVLVGDEVPPCPRQL